VIEISHVVKSYGDKRVVDDVSLRFEAGGVTSIIGSNGAGKSTLLALMSRLITPDCGKIHIGGLDVMRTSGNRLAKTLSILRQENSLNTRLRVRELVGFGRYPHSKGRLTLADRQHIDKAIAYLDLEDLAERFLDELSGGQRQRAFVAMVICQDTDYVFLDEPLNNLDMKHASAMMKLLRRISDELGKTIITVLHDINFASLYSDRIVAMRSGKIVAVDRPEHIVTTEILREIYDFDIEVHQIKKQRIATYYA